MTPWLLIEAIEARDPKRIDERDREMGLKKRARAAKAILDATRQTAAE